MEETSLKRQPSLQKFKRAGYTLMELVLVLAVLTILIAIAMPRLINYYHNSKEIERQKHEMLVGKALRQYYAYEGHFPDPDPSNPPIFPARLLTNAEEEELENQLLKVASVRIDTAAYNFIYNETSGECSVEIDG
jgi:prepilin-type N-terminal cleavage/methylation domain-containing protein